MRVRLLLAAATLAAGGPTLAAQAVARPVPRVGTMAGVTVATLAGEPVERWDRRTGVVIGGTLTLPLTAVVAFQPELLIAQKGAKVSEDGLTATLKLDYVEVPLLLRVDVPATGGAVRPHLYAGPALALRARCAFALSGGGARASRSCRDVTEGEDAADFRAVDAGLLFGGGLGFDVGRRRLTVGVRYDLGLTTIVPDDAVRNRALTVYGGLDVPIGR